MVWLVLAGGLLVAELFTLTFVLGIVSVAALVTAGVAALDAPVAGQVAVFGVTNAVLFMLVKPFERRQRQAPALTTGTAALVGKQALVLEAVTADGGRVKLGGESWAARATVPGLTLDVGSHVSVDRVDGATLVVYPEEF